MIEKSEKDYNPEKIEEECKKYWKENNIRKRSRKNNDGEKFYFVDGPPYTTGKIHLGTTWNKIIKDSVLRYKTLKGAKIDDTPGWDMHGLPIEVKVEKKFGFEDKSEVEEFGVERFVNECKKFALDFKDQMTEQFKEFGSWFNWEEPYMTLSDEFIESVWWTIKRSEERNLLEQGKRVNNWCPRCETAIADSEVEYDEITDPSIYVKFQTEKKPNRYLVIWTTTPWTIPANLAVGVHPNHEYSIVEAKKDGDTEELILASDLFEELLEKIGYQEWKVIDTKLGKELEGMRYHHPLREVVKKQKEIDNEKIHQVYAEEFVSVEKTGLVHMAPSHGEEDYKIGEKRNLPIIELVGKDGKYLNSAGKYESTYVRDANQEITEDLREKDLLLEKNEIKHRYGFCWRCDTPIIYLATQQWFITVTNLKNKMINEIDKTKWIPEWAGESRFKDWVSNAKDWCISRQRFWGTPMPVWICQKCNKRDVIGSKQELLNKSRDDIEEIELHRPFVDKIKLNCECGGEKERVKDVLDVWMDSACASWANLNYPKEDQEFEEWWPADFITEGHDQTRGWFYSQLGAGTIAFDQVPYKSVLMHGFVLDEDGRKMSKSVGNVVQPEEIIKKFGSDTLRFYLLNATAPWDDLRFSWEECENIRRTLNVFWNVYKFATTYMSIDEFKPRGYEDLELRVEDKWILSKTQSLIKEIKEEMENYHIHEYSRKLEKFILEDLSRWYVRLIRDRTWVEAKAEEKEAAYEVLYKVMRRTLILMSPITPFLSEKMYLNLVKNVAPDFKSSVHMETYPEYKESEHFPQLEKDMENARNVIEAASHARQQKEMKLRWPVKRIVVSVEDKEIKESLNKTREIIKDQTNSHEIEVLKPEEEFKELKVVSSPNYDIIGPKFKDKANKIAKKIEKANGEELKKELPTKLRVQNEDITIKKSMVEFKKEVPEEYSMAEFEGGKVYVDTKITEKIKKEGLARELVRRIQEMRKEMELDEEEKINVTLNFDDKEIEKTLQDWKQYIEHETRTKQLEIKEADGELIKEWDIEDKEVEISITRGE